MNVVGKTDIIIQELLKLDRDTVYEIEINEYVEKRSNDANAYAWVLIGEIAKKVRNNKTNVYREFIKRSGKYEIMPIREDAVETFKKMWAKNGLGCICDDLGNSKLEGYKNIVVYYGSSSYNKKEMAYFIDEIVFEAKKMGIETLPPDQIEALKSAW